MDKEKALKVWEFLENNHLAVLATVSEENAPQASLIYYVTEEDFHLYIVTGKDSRKYINISKNNKVSLVIGQEKTAQVLQIEGEAKVVEDSSKKTFISGKYLEIANESNPKSLNWPPVLKLSSTEGFVFIEIGIISFKFSDFSGRQSLIIEGTAQDWN